MKANIRKTRQFIRKMSANQYTDAMFFYCLGILALFLYYNHFEDSWVNKIYYLLFKFKELVLVYGYSYFLKGKRKRICIIISWFYLVRVVWQLFELENYQYANRPYIIDLLFFVCIVSVLRITTINSTSHKKNGRD